MRSLQGVTGQGYERGRHVGWQVGWVLCQSIVVKRAWLPPRCRVAVLRAFGAHAGTGVLIRDGVTIHWPWKLRIGDHSWIGAGVWILNLEDVTIGHDCCISQQALLCTGSHDRISSTFEFDNAPITIGDGVWVASRATVLRGVTISDAAVVGACALVAHDVPEGHTVLAPPSRAECCRPRSGTNRMRILQAVTWVAPGNPFGGPVTVALNQADELRRRGREVEVIAAQPAPAALGSWLSSDHDVRGFSARRILPGAGFSGLIAPGLLRYAWQYVRAFDVVHVHVARDLITLPTARIAGLRDALYVVQSHGMIDPSARRSARVLDRFVTRKVMTDAEVVFALTDREREDLAAVVPGAQLAFHLLRNGVPLPDLATISTGHDTDTTPEVLFCSRLHVRKRPVLFANVASALLDRGVHARFTIVGADEGELGAVRAALAAAGHADDVAIHGSIQPGAVAARLGACDILVLPSVDEPFPKVVLETLASARPVVISASCGLSDFVTEHRCGVVVADDNPAQLERAVRRLVDSPAERRAMGASGRDAVNEHLGMGAVGDQLERIYSAAVHRAAGRRGR